MRDEVILVTGCAGFIGSNLTKQLLIQGNTVIGIDSINHAYDPLFKKENLTRLTKHKNFFFYKKDVTDPTGLELILQEHQPSKIIHLAARTGIRKSLRYPDLYHRINVEGTKILYIQAHQYGIKQFIFASSSSVYGNSIHIPFNENQKLPMPPSPYANSKQKAEEIIKKLYQKYQLPTTILRFFSVYGPNGRPDMAPYLFTQAALNNKPIMLYGNGTTSRDYTYIDDILRGIICAMTKPLPFEIINLGNNHPISLQHLIDSIESFTHCRIIINRQPWKKEESKTTWADIVKARKVFGWQPQITFKKGIEQFIKWYQNNRL